MGGRDEWAVKADTYLNRLCVEIGERCVGSEGNRAATQFVAEKLNEFGWDTRTPAFPVMDWVDSGAHLDGEKVGYDLLVSPYSLGCDLSAELVEAESVAGLERIDCGGRIILLHGEIAREQLMPKNFIFYNPEEHRKIIALLEEKQPGAIVCATGRNAALAGGVYPFPLIEDGDFDIPSVYTAEETGKKIRELAGCRVHLRSISQRIPGTACNVIAKKEGAGSDRIVVTAHIDAKKGTPGAIDNASGVTVLLLIAELLREYRGHSGIELVGFNGEDYYAVPGQMNYIGANRDRFNEMLLNINIDGAGYREGPSSFALFGLPEHLEKKVRTVLRAYGMVEGPQWPQGDHSIFVQHGRPAVAVSSQWFIEHLESQTITHTPADNLEIVDRLTVAGLAAGLAKVVEAIGR